MNLALRYLLMLFVGLFAGAQLAIGQNEPGTAAPTAAVEDLPLEDLRVFTEVFAKVKSDYVEDVRDKSLLENSIRGMLNGLDPHSAYLNADEYKTLQEGTSGEFGGLGIEVGIEDGFVKVISPIDDTPAHKAGIQAGDVIIKIDDTPTKGMSLGEAVEKMRGKPGSPIKLSIMRQGQEQPLEFTIKRDIIKVDSVKGRTLEPGFVYLRISHFQQHTGEDLNDTLSKLKRGNGDKLKGLILDLRNNPGGVLNSAVEICDAFMDRGKIVYTQGRVKDSQLEFSANPGDLLKGAPMVVLINGGSASASEIVAGALQDSLRAVIMGSQSFGKGSVQTILPMNNGAALKITTARYFTPKGRSIQAQGITPDIMLGNVKIAAAEAVSDDIKERNLSRHLENNTQKEGNEVIAPPRGNANSDDAAPQDSDYEVHEALNMLKGMVLLQERGTR
ncbi:MAG: S41 family peptidase [Chromatiales bacterium]